MFQLNQRSKSSATLRLQLTLEGLHKSPPSASTPSTTSASVCVYTGAKVRNTPDSLAIAATYNGTGDVSTTTAGEVISTSRGLPVCPLGLPARQHNVSSDQGRPEFCALRLPDSVQLLFQLCHSLRDGMIVEDERNRKRRKLGREDKTAYEDAARRMLK